MRLYDLVALAKESARAHSGREKKHFDSSKATAPLRNSFGNGSSTITPSHIKVKEFLCTLKQLSNSKFVNQLFILYISLSYPLPRNLPCLDTKTLLV
jgi:hypothetical protein